MNYFFSKYSQTQTPPVYQAQQQHTEPRQDSVKQEVCSDNSTNTTNAAGNLKSQLDLQLNPNHNPTTPISFTNPNSNKKLSLDKNKNTTTEILSLQIAQNSTSSSNMATASIKPQLFMPNTTNTNLVLPALSQSSSARSNSLTPNTFSSNFQHNTATEDSTPRSNQGKSSSSSLSLMNQNINCSNLRNKLCDYGDVLAKLNNGDTTSAGRSQALTPLTSKLTINFDKNHSLPGRRPELKNFDFRSETNQSMPPKKQQRPNQLSFPHFKQQLNSLSSNSDKSGDEMSFSSLSSRNSPSSLSQPRLEQVNADKYREILKNAGYLLINGQRIKTSMDDLSSISELGSGTCGQVYKMVHNPTGYVMAVKQMGITGVAEENKRIIMDLDVVLKSHDCGDIVKCLGYFISDSDVWICMELMSMCFDKLLKRIKKPIPEEILGKMSVSTLNALNYLKQSHNVIHRDIKPSNILINENGQMKLCDFGISGNLINSNAKSRNNTGCAGYMAPERIDPPDHENPVYDIRADVWSLGLTLVELATGEYPYKKCKNEFEVMSTILYQDAPTYKLDTDQFSSNFKSFVNICLVKDVNKRPKYNILLQHPFILQYKDPELEIDVKSWFKNAFAHGANNGNITPMSSMSNLTIDNDCESTSTTPTATSNSLISM